jgi:gluconate 2-dehydrogenase gamma chain
MKLHRRNLLTGTALFLLGGFPARADLIKGYLPWTPNAGTPPEPVRPGPWRFFTAQEGRAMEAMADRFIPPDPQTPGGKDVGCAVFVDRQLAGPYGQQDGDYVSPPFMKGTRQQGAQSEGGPARTIRDGLAALDGYCAAQFGGKVFADLSDDQKDEVLSGIETDKVKLDRADGKAFFAEALKLVQQGFFADPLYGGNRNMAAWKMIGFPGARYNYLDWIDRHNETFPLPPVSIVGRAEWLPDH